MSAPFLVCLLTNLQCKNHFLAAADTNNLRFVNWEAFSTRLDAHACFIVSVLAALAAVFQGRRQ